MITQPAFPRLAYEFLTLPPHQRRAVHFRLCQHALAKWQRFVGTQGPMLYVESVVGTQQEVDRQLPADAYEAATQGVDWQNIRRRYLEPISALQDDDLKFPEHVELAYYAIYNLFRKYALREDCDDWLIVSQALSSEEDSQQWKVLLADALQQSSSGL